MNKSHQKLAVIVAKACDDNGRPPEYWPDVVLVESEQEAIDARKRGRHALQKANIFKTEECRDGEREDG